MDAIEAEQEDLRDISPDGTPCNQMGRRISVQKENGSKDRVEFFWKSFGCIQGEDELWLNDRGGFGFV